MVLEAADDAEVMTAEATAFIAELMARTSACTLERKLFIADSTQVVSQDRHF